MWKSSTANLVLRTLISGKHERNTSETRGNVLNACVFSYYNRTRYGGLETHIRNSYCNSLLQMLFFVKPLRNVAISHIKTSCPREHCLLCELGFLFRMLEDSKGQNCQATNFLRVFSTFPQGKTLMARLCEYVANS